MKEVIHLNSIFLSTEDKWHRDLEELQYWSWWGARQVLFTPNTVFIRNNVHRLYNKETLKL